MNEPHFQLTFVSPLEGHIFRGNLVTWKPVRSRAHNPQKTAKHKDWQGCGEHGTLCWAGRNANWRTRWQLLKISKFHCPVVSEA